MTEKPNESTSVSNNEGPQPEAFPVADVQTGGGLIETLKASRLWLLTAACLVAAIVLTWMSVGRSGPKVVVRFDEGHGIKAGDTVRYRGIEVGQVATVELTEDLSGIATTVRLNAASADLAREGTRFWIVRPLLSLTGVSGLETAVGSKYMAVDPGDAEGANQATFVGLSEPPADGLEHDGLQVRLSAAEKHGFGVGAPVTYRGVDVGTVISTELNDDRTSVIAVARIAPEYAQLVTTQSRFWVSGGLGFDLGLSGLHIDADSLATVARGGIAFISPAEATDSQAVPANHQFTLHEEPNTEWFTGPTPSLRDRIPFLGRSKSEPGS